jgi:hypothetical protein
VDQIRRPPLESIPRHYMSYLLRAWQASEDEPALWRASLESPHTGERVGFENLEMALEFLRRQILPEGSSPATIEPRPDESGKS